MEIIIASQKAKERNRRARAQAKQTKTGQMYLKMQQKLQQQMVIKLIQALQCQIPSRIANAQYKPLNDTQTLVFKSIANELERIDACPKLGTNVADRNCLALQVTNEITKLIKMN